jgi:hypothetical protein
MKKIKLKFRHEFERDAFYDRAWCHLDGLPQCATCARNKYRYANWDSCRAYTSFGFSDAAFDDAKRGDCPMFVQAKDIINVPTKEKQRTKKKGGKK